MSGFQEFYELLPREKALALLEPYLRPVDGAEEVPLEAALGRVLAAEVAAPEPLPAFARSTVDGYAVRARDTFGASEGQPALLTLAGQVNMGEVVERSLGAGEAVQVFTGGALPPGADAVVMFEHTGEGGSLLEVFHPVAPGENAVRPGEDFAAGNALLPGGRRLRPADLGALAALGLTRVTVRRRPRVGILSTGDEVVPATERPRPGQVRDVNSHVLAGFVREAGGEPELGGIVPDDREALAGRVAALLPRVDLLLLSGGSSTGARDHTLAVINSLGPPGVVVHGLALKPGKPTVIGVAGRKLIFGLPGHPAAAAVAFRAVVRPALLALGGAPSQAGLQVSARLAVNLPSASGREEFVRVRLVSRPDGWWAEPVEGPSGFLSTFVRSDGFVVIPLEATGLEAGAEVAVELD
ncbi:MAG: molybdopterin molybdotransferase MoeA [Bacillota bacterium]|nr:molybdopterin molybdotransferase MoeA [Bacillota bacterium]